MRRVADAAGYTTRRYTRGCVLRGWVGVQSDCHVCGWRYEECNYTFTWLLPLIYSCSVVVRKYTCRRREILLPSLMNRL